MPPPSAAEQPPTSEGAPPEPKIEGVTAKGLPFSQRGGIVADFAALRIAGGDFQGNGTPVASIDVLAHIPVADRTFLDLVVPIGFGAIGNPMAGAHHVFRLSDRLWITLGGAIGVPLVNNDVFTTFEAARALWDFEEFAEFTVPFATRFGLEGHAGIAEFRVELDPVWGVAVRSNASHSFALQHAVEVQLGHAIGGGVRYQGVAAATNTFDGDHYQGAMELFFRIYRDPIFARLGFVLPLDAPLGSSGGGRTWGIRAQTGFNLD